MGREWNVVDAAGEFFTAQLASSRMGMAYINSRFHTPPEQLPVGVGFAPGGWDGLTRHLVAEGFSEDDLVAAGVSKYSSRGNMIDVFRDRIMFDVVDLTGRVCGWSGRDISQQPQQDGFPRPKYINSRSSEIFDKSKCWIGFNPLLLAAGAVPVICEGGPDAIAVTLATGYGLTGVASMGTRLSAEQAKTLWDATTHHKVMICRDNDTPGREATIRDMKVLAGAGFKDIEMIEIPQHYKDIAEAWQKTPTQTRTDLAASNIKLRPVIELAVDTIAASYATDLSRGYEEITDRFVHQILETARPVCTHTGRAHAIAYAAEVTATYQHNYQKQQHQQQPEPNENTYHTHTQGPPQPDFLAHHHTQTATVTTATALTR